MVVTTFQDCPHAPACSAQKGCCYEHAAVPVSWATGVVDQAQDGTWLVHQWQHPRETMTHRSTAGESADRAPKWAK